MQAAIILSSTLLDHARTLALPTIRRILSKRRNAANHRKLDLLRELTGDLLRATRASLALGIAQEQLARASSHDDDRETMVSVLARIESDRREN